MGVAGGGDGMRGCGGGGIVDRCGVRVDCFYGVWQVMCWSG